MYVAGKIYILQCYAVMHSEYRMIIGGLFPINYWQRLRNDEKETATSLITVITSLIISWNCLILKWPNVIDLLSNHIINAETEHSYLYL
jgi:hypothetical protein